MPGREWRGKLAPGLGLTPEESELLKARMEFIFHGAASQMWIPRWIRRAIRRRMKPMNEYDAMTWQMKLSFVYAFCAWNGLGMVGYYIFHDRANDSEFLGMTLDDDKMKRPGGYYAELLKAPNPKIIRIEGLTVTESVEYKSPDYETVKKEEY